MLRYSVLTALTLGALAIPAHAQDRKALRDACVGDAQKLCANVQRGQGRIVQCLKSHEAELSPACRDGLAKARR